MVKPTGRKRAGEAREEGAGGSHQGWKR